MRQTLILTLTTALLFAITGLGRAADSPIVIAPGLFDMEAGDTRGLPTVEGAETFTIYRAQDNTYKFANHPQLIVFKGRFYATWQATPLDEDSDDSVAVYSVSDDGKTWSKPMVIAPPLPGSLYHASAGWWSDGQTLVCYILRMEEASAGNTKMTVARTSTDGDNWSDFIVVLPTAIASASPQQIPGGRLIFEGHGTAPEGVGHVCQLFYSDELDGFNGWTQAELPFFGPWNESKDDQGNITRKSGRASEPSLFVRADGNLTMIFRDTVWDRAKRTYRVLASISEDRGQTWSMPVLTDMPDSQSMQCCGNLPDGTAYMINCPSRELWQRVPLAITLSSDGITFDRSFVVRGTPPERRYEGKSKTFGYSYPSAMIHDNALWIAAAVNKEDIEVTRVPLSSLIP
ncbi:MAG: exo-alpha-sialidase [Phycisphaeraceae bacterium]|nr:exo-alpha-sialidase [Phycisphaeraceae bacterium]